MEEENKYDFDRQRSVDFLKGICILLVIFTHCTWTEAERLKYLFPFWVDMAVPVFMILSQIFLQASCRHFRKSVWMEKFVQESDPVYAPVSDCLFDGRTDFLVVQHKT